MKKLILIIIPTYNEENTIQITIRSILNEENIPDYTKKIIIIDSSTDNTIKNIKEINANNIIVVNQKKRGIGCAYKKAIKLCFKLNPYAIITFDGDGQHDVTFINKSIVLLMKYDFINASRFLKKSQINDDKYNRKIITKIGNYIIRLIYTKLNKITDLTSGLQCIKFDIIKKINIEFLSDNYEFQVDIKKNICSLTNNLVEIPIIFNNRYGGESKNKYSILQKIKYIINFIK